MTSGAIAVVGMACVFPDAADLETYWRNIVNGRDAIRRLPAGRWPGSRNTSLPDDHFAHVSFDRGGFIPTPFLFDALRFRVMPRVAQDGDVDQFILLQVIAAALADAAIDSDDPCRERTDLIVGRGGYTSNKMMEIFLRADLIDRLDVHLRRRLPDAVRREVVGEMLSGLPALDADSMASSIPNLVASRTANRLDLQGAAFTVDAACASSLIAVEEAVRRLRDGVCDVGVVGGVNFTQVPSFWYLFDRILAVSASGRAAPFDRNADGMLIGEGAGAVILKRYADAVEAHDRIYAVVRGVGSASDGQVTGVLAPAVRGQIAALARAHDDGQIEPDTIDLVEAHGTGTVQGDAAEIETLARFYGPPRAGLPTRALGSVKSMIGHTMPAAGIASFIKAALSLSSRILPPSLNCVAPHPALQDTPFFVNTLTRPWIRDPERPPRRAGINAFGFGGINAHVILEESPPDRKRRRVVPAARPVGGRAGADAPATSVAAAPMMASVRDRPTELLVFAGETAADVVAAVRQVHRFLETDGQPHSLEDVAFSLVEQFPEDPACRLAVVVEAGDGASARLVSVADRIDRGEIETAEAEGLFFSGRAAGPAGQVVALFPGQGFPGLVGHYPDHLMEFCLHVPGLTDIFDRVEARDGHPGDPLPTSYLLVPPAHLPADVRARLRDRFGTKAPLAGVTADSPPPGPDERRLSAMGMLVSNWVSWLILEPFEIPFSMACGQSLGDISALCAAGMIDFEEIIPRLWPYLSIDERVPGAGCLAFVGTSEETLGPFMEAAGDVQIALHLSPQTQIVGGTEPAVDRLVAQLRDTGVMAQKLPFPPVHTPRLTGLQEQLQEMEGEPVPMRPPQLAVYSTITEKPMPDEFGELRSLVAGNISRPVRFWQTVRRMYADGGRVFVQVGTGTLAGNIRSILPEEDVLTVALDVDYRHPITQLQHLCGSLIVRGVSVRLDALFAARRPRHLDLAAPRAPRQESGIPLRLYWPPLSVSPGEGTGPERVPVDIGGGAPDSRRTPISPALPMLDRILEYAPGRRVVAERVLDLDEDLFLADHCFIHPDGVKPVPECFPVLPLTMTLEMMAEAAACLAPGNGVIAIEKVRARQWIALDGVRRLPVRVEATRAAETDGVVRVSVEVRAGERSVASATICLAGRYRLGVQMAFSPPVRPRSYPIKPSRLYTDRYYFHGPSFRCLESVEELGDRGIRGHLSRLAADGFFAGRDASSMILDPVALDGAGQMFGAIFFGQDLYVLPVAIDIIEFYRPAPLAGTRLPVRVEVVEFDRKARRTSAQIEVEDGDGQVWFRIRGWQDIIFRWGRPMLEVQRQPLTCHLARELAMEDLGPDVVAAVLPVDRLRDVQIARLARLYLDGSEWPAFEAAGTSPRRQKEWLMGRIAAKDAVRMWLVANADRKRIHPCQVILDNDEAGRPSVRIVDDPRQLSISLAHVRAGSAAVVAGRPVGIDVEPETAGSALERDDFATSSELRLLDRIDGGRDEIWTTRLWCAKEAAAKAAGTGLRGRPRAFQVESVMPSGPLVLAHGDPPAWFNVHLAGDGGLTVAVAVPADPSATRAGRAREVS
ncbi:MAG: beta-ketoacyl synthase N-terminal-like domain-containing protein [Acidobacteriota bacterium]